uniref:RdRp n=1 Tax=Wenling partiti-like virus 6 TaxID=1923524 RepID=A0A1L3KLS4_9VIRU|nr:RdRp [Wenling partiti-like virus 6]
MHWRLRPYYHRAQARFRRSRPSRADWSKWIATSTHKRKLADEVEWDNERWEEAVEALTRDLKRLTVDTIPLAACPDTFKTLANSPGLDEQSFKRYETKGDVPWSEVEDFYKLLSEGKSHKCPPFSVAFRNHIVGKDAPNKARVILVAPAALTIVEKKFSAPLALAMRGTAFPKHWATGFDWFRGDGHHMMTYIRSDRALSTDWSTFDLSAPEWMIRDIYRCMYAAFPSLHAEEARVFQSISDIHARCYVQHGNEKFHMRGGVKTGSSFTHIEGTLINIAMQYYIHGKDAEFLCYGDDTVVKSALSPRQIARFVHKHSSFTMSVEKTHKGVQWLGLCYRDERWVLINPAKRWASLFMPERPNNHPDGFARNMQAHLIAAGEDDMASILRDVLEDEGHHDLIPGGAALSYKNRVLADYEISVIAELESRLKILL